MAATSFDTLFEVRAMPALERLHGTTVTLSRGADTSPDITGVIRGDVEYEDIGGKFGFPIKLTSRMYVLPKSKVLISAVEVEPREGDRINDGSEVFEIHKQGKEPAVKLDSSGNRWEVLTEKVT